MTTLELWIERATKRLSRESAAQVRAEITEHFQSTREAAISNGASAEVADRLAIEALGDSQSANKQYRQVLLTETEAKALRRGNREASFICSHSWLKWTMLILPVAGFIVAAALWINGKQLGASMLIAATMLGSTMLLAPFLPVYTPSRSRIFRIVKWVVQIAAFILIFGPDALKMSWLIACCVWPIFQMEWTRMAIRRKLPLAQWPKQLYL